MSLITNINKNVTVKDSRETINSNFANLDERVETLENRKIVSNEGNWEAGEQVEVGDIRFLGGRDNAGYILVCVEAGTTGTTQPTFTEDDVEGTLLFATKAEAEAGEANDKIMSPYTVKAVVDNAVNTILAANVYASAALINKDE